MDSESFSVRQPVSRLLFFDTGLPRMEKCLDDGSCLNSSDILCRHRLHPDTEVLYLDDLSCASFLRLYDFQVILYFIYLVAFKKIKTPLSQNCVFTIVTHDKRFLRSAKSEWVRRKKKSQRILRFDSKNVLAKIDHHSRTEMINIGIRVIKMKARSTDGWRKKIISIFLV